MIKRLITEKQRQSIKEYSKFKNKKEFTQEEINNLVMLIAKKLNII